MRFAESLQTNTTLTSLDLGGKNQVMERHTYSKTHESFFIVMQYSVNMIGDAGITSVIKMLGKNTTLKRLILPCLRIIDKVVISLFLLIMN